MAADEVAAEAVAGAQRLLEVDGAGARRGRRCSASVAADTSKREARAVARDHGEAAAVHRDAVADRDVVGAERRRVDDDAQAVAARLTR